ncbi:25785_t:CDS:1, partial [Racocetra persica]
EALLGRNTGQFNCHEKLAIYYCEEASNIFYKTQDKQLKGSPIKFQKAKHYRESAA